jgi:hypothetical protein
MSPEQKPNPEPLTSGDSDFESATGSPALELTEQGESSQPPIDKLIEGGPQINFEEEHNPLVKSSYFTEP